MTGAPAAHLAVSVAQLPQLTENLQQLVAERFASQLFAQDPNLWGSTAAVEAAQRLAWVDLGRSSRPLLGAIAALRAELLEAGWDQIALAGMGGSSLAPEVMCAASGVSLTVLDSSDPDAVNTFLTRDLSRTVLVVSSKSGNTVETDSQRRAVTAAFVAAGIDPGPRIIIVTDPDSPLAKVGQDLGHRVIFADPKVGGRYSALTAFGLVPAGLAGVDVGGLLDDAELASDLLRLDAPDNPALTLAAALAGSRQSPPSRDKLLLAPVDSPLPGFADWIEQLIAESTGKHGTGLLPVVLPASESPELSARLPDALPVFLTGPETELVELPGPQVQVSGSLGGQFLLWEVATAAAGRLLGINPFDQPDVERAKIAARGFLGGTSARTQSAPDLLDRGLGISASPGLLGSAEDLPGAIAALVDTIGDHDYLAVMAYLDRHEHRHLAQVRDSLAARTGRPVTFGWGPRFLHSTGQYHKGGPATGVFLQITGAPQTELPIPEQPFTFAQLIAAQAAGDAQVLIDSGRPLLHLHLLDRPTGVAHLLEELT